MDTIEFLKFIMRLSVYETTSLCYSPIIHISTEVHISFVIELYCAKMVLHYFLHYYTFSKY